MSRFGLWQFEYRDAGSLSIDAHHSSPVYTKDTSGLLPGGAGQASATVHVK